MRKYILFASLCTLFMSSCENNSTVSNENNDLKKDINGAYVRAYSYEVKNMSTNQVVGIKVIIN